MGTPWIYATIFVAGIAACALVLNKTYQAGERSCQTVNLRMQIKNREIAAAYYKSAAEAALEESKQANKEATLIKAKYDEIKAQIDNMPDADDTFIDGGFLRNQLSKLRQ